VWQPKQAWLRRRIERIGWPKPVAGAPIGDGPAGQHIGRCCTRTVEWAHRRRSAGDAVCGFTEDPQAQPSEEELRAQATVRVAGKYGRLTRSDRRARSDEAGDRAGRVAARSVCSPETGRVTARTEVERLFPTAVWSNLKFCGKRRFSCGTSARWNLMDEEQNGWADRW
jgi:hypothetical protein